MDRLQPEKAVEMLRQKGMEVSVEEAKMILEFLEVLANIVVENYLEKHW